MIMTNRKLIWKLTHPRSLFLSFLYYTAPMWPDALYLRLKFRLRMNYKLDLKKPTTFNEKLQWLKLYNRRPEYTKMVDKVDVKEYVASIIGSEYIIPTIAIYDKVEQIDFEKLPNQFVLKCTHDSGGVVICKDKSKLDIRKTERNLKKALKQSYYYQNREWPYKHVPRRIICEEYMSDNGKDLVDYKIHCFDGIPKVILVCKNRYKKTGLTEDFFSDKWAHLTLKRPNHPNSSEIIAAPKELNKILELSCKLSKNLLFIRTDFYIINSKVYFGELTFFPSTGMTAFYPDTWDKVFGDWITVNSI